jgi:hypothetical protein
VGTVLLKVPIEDGTDEFVEVEAEADGVILASIHDRISAFSLGSAMDSLLPVLRTIVKRVRDAEHAPHEIAVELGLKVGGEQGFILTKGTAEATLTLTLTWRNNP